MSLLSVDEERVLHTLTVEAQHIDVICTKLQWPVARVSGALGTLELKGIVIRDAGMRFKSNSDEEPASNTTDMTTPLQPLSAIKLTQAKRFWQGTLIHQDSPFVSDGRIMIDTRSAKKGTEKRLRKLHTGKSRYTDEPMTSQRAQSLWDGLVKNVIDSEEIKLLGWKETPGGVKDTPRTAYFDIGDDYVMVNADYLRFIYHVIEPDVILQQNKGRKKEFRPIVFMKYDSPEAVLQPLEIEAKNYLSGVAIDLELARKQLG